MRTNPYREAHTGTASHTDADTHTDPHTAADTQTQAHTQTNTQAHPSLFSLNVVNWKSLAIS